MEEREETRARGGGGAAAGQEPGAIPCSGAGLVEEGCARGEEGGAATGEGEGEELQPERRKLAQI